MKKKILVKLIKYRVDKYTIKHRIDLLISRDYISLLNDDEIILSEADKTPESIVKWLDDAAIEAFKCLKDSHRKTMTYLAYVDKFKEVYSRKK